VVLTELEEKGFGWDLGYRSSFLREFLLAPIHPSDRLLGPSQWHERQKSGEAANKQTPEPLPSHILPSYKVSLLIFYKLYLTVCLIKKYK
jgi:hypothetical protein